MGLWDTEDLGIGAERASWALFGVTTVIVLLRIICRTKLVRGGGWTGHLGLDDYITVLCVVVLLVSCVMISIGTRIGIGRRMATMEPEQIVQSLRWNVITNCVLVWSFSLPKFAIVAILGRILSHGLKTSILFWGLAISSQGLVLAASVWWFKQCTPVAFGWDKSIPGGTCAPMKVLIDFGYFFSAYSAFLDLFFALYPIPFIMRLNMALKSRIAVSMALSFSSLACIVSIYKLAVFGEIFNIMGEDPTYPPPVLDVLAVAEGAILIICASLPTLGPIYRMAQEKHRSTNGSTRITNEESAVGGPSGSDTATWSSGKGQDHDLENGSRTTRSIHSSSVDEIPLVPSPKHGWPLT